MDKDICGPAAFPALASAASPHILLVNPWIHDFAAYDFWANPLGLLSLGAMLRQYGARISFVDCLDRFHPRLPDADHFARFGRGPYHKTCISKPAGMEDIPRNYCRYGILPEWFQSDLKSLPRPDLVLVTSMMTYWYPGVQEAISIVKSVYPDVPVILGGIYATLCQEHAIRFSGADLVIAGPGETQLFAAADKLIGWSAAPEDDPDDLDAFPFPAADLQRRIPFAALLTSTGCPFSCAYCASGYLNSRRRLRSPDRIVEEIRFWNSCYGVRDMVFYDDALLVDSECHAIPLFEKIIACGLGKKVRFHTPNAVHIREITNTTAQLMADAGFQTLRLGLETAAGDRKDIDHKVTRKEFFTAVSCLKSAGFLGDQIGAYLLTGLPGQSWDSVEASVKTVREAGITPVPAHFTPIPHTALWPAAVASSRYDLESDPLFTNNAIFPCQKESFSW
ncbi:MAG: radical SAM protein, partial [Desulfatirhabdiaceae bacterium]|nr:radical SAM protein [Desulfatirhabdiaceae bacterium]